MCLFATIMFIVFFMTKVLLYKNRKEVAVVTQDEVRAKLKERVKREKQTYIASQIGVSKQVISDFKLGRKDLYPEYLIALNEYLSK